MFLWGVNHAVDAIVTRWKRSEFGSIVERDGKKVLEFVCVFREAERLWSLPGEWKIRRMENGQ